YLRCVGFCCSDPFLLVSPPPPTALRTLSLHDALPIYFLRRSTRTRQVAPTIQKAMTQWCLCRSRACSHSLFRTTSESMPSNGIRDRKSTRLNSSHVAMSYAVLCLKKKAT